MNKNIDIINKQKIFEFILNNNNYLKLLNEYNSTPETYNIYIINNIIFNINSRKVSHFKDFLLLYDPNDFIRKYYYKKECFAHLKYYISFYEENNKIFPNYFCLPESKYIYWNIRQKQNILNNIENMNMNTKFKKKHQSYSTIFSNSIKRSIYNESEYPSNSINSKADEGIKKLIKTINENYSNISYIKKKEKKNDISVKNINKKKNSQNIKKNNNLNFFNKISLISKKKENIFDMKNKLKNENICLSERIQNLNQTNKNYKHKRFMTNYNKELITPIYGNSKKIIDINKNIKTIEKNDKNDKIKKLVKVIKLVLNNNNNSNHKSNNKNELDSINNIKMSNTSRNININSKILKSFFKTINTNKMKLKKDLINQNNLIKKNKKTTIKNIVNNSKKEFSNKLSIKRKAKKTNKRFLNHIKTKSNLLIDSIYKKNIYHNSIILNNNSVSYNSLLLGKKIENKLLTTESYPKLKKSTQKINNKKNLLKNCLTSKRKVLNELYFTKEKVKNNLNEKYKEASKYIINENKNELSDFSTQINFKNNKSIIKESISRTEEKIKTNRKESKIYLLTKNSKYIKKKNDDSKKKKLGLKSRNNTALNSISINLNNINNLKISNNLFTTINIYETIKNKNKKVLKKESSNSKIVNDTSCFDNKKLLRTINDYKYINKKNQSNIKNDYSTKRNHNKTNSSIINNLDIGFSINKTASNFNNLINKNLILKKSNNYMIKKGLKIKKIKPSLFKNFENSDKDFLYPQNSDRVTTFYKNNDSFKINLKVNNNTVRKLSNDEKRINMISSYITSERNNNKNQKKIKIQNFKNLMENLNSEKKEIDRNKLNSILNSKKFFSYKAITDS